MDLVACRFGKLPAADVYDDFMEKFDSLRNETDFDLFLWSLAHQLKVDTEELLRQLGERWIANLAESEEMLRPGEQPFLQSADWLVSQSGLLEKAPLLGMKTFRAAVVSRGQNAMRVCCVGPRRCCTFLEGVVRGLGDANGESVRYVRQPQSATLLELLFKTFEKPN